MSDLAYITLSGDNLVATYADGSSQVLPTTGNARWLAPPGNGAGQPGAPATPNTRILEITPTSVRFDWDELVNAGGIAYRLNGGDPVDVGSGVLTNRSHTITGLTAGTEYTLEVQAYGGTSREASQWYQLSGWSWHQFTTGTGSGAVNGGITITARMVEAAVTSVGGSVNNMFRGSPLEIANMFNDAIARTYPGLLTNAKRAACIVGECAQETDWFRTFEEYPGANGWPQGIWHGRGMIQLTWEANYRAFGQWCLGFGLVNSADYFVNNPGVVSSNQWAALTAIYYFTVPTWGGKTLIEMCDTSSSPWYNISGAINAGDPSYVGPSYDIRATAINAALAVAPESSSVRDRLTQWMRDHESRYFYTQDMAMRIQPDASGGTDCSGLVRYCYQQVAQIEVGTYTDDQQANYGQPVDLAGLLPGDLVFFRWSNPPGGAYWSHVEMFMGNGQTMGHGGDPYYGPVLKSLSGQVSVSQAVVARRYV